MLNEKNLVSMLIESHYNIIYTREYECKYKYLLYYTKYKIKEIAGYIKMYVLVVFIIGGT